MEKLGCFLRVTQLEVEEPRSKPSVDWQSSLLATMWYQLTSQA